MITLSGAGCSPPGGGGGLVGPLDDLTTGLWGAYSVYRLLLSSYSGPLLRVRRSSDNTERDIDALPTGTLDSATLLAFCGAGNGFVTKVYDQLDLADLVQATAGSQPQIVASGVLCVNNLNIPAMQGSAKRVATTFVATMTLPVTVYSNATPSTNAAYELLWGLAGSNRWFGKTNTQTLYGENGRMTSYQVSNINYDLCYSYGGLGLDQLYVDGVNRGTAGQPGLSVAGVTSTGMAWGSMFTGANPWNGKMTELVVFNAVHNGPKIAEISAALAIS